MVRYVTSSVLYGIILSFSDKSIPTLESVILEKGNNEHQSLSNLVSNQIKFEESVNNKQGAQTRDYLSSENECCAPP